MLDVGWRCTEEARSGGETDRPKGDVKMKSLISLRARPSAGCRDHRLADVSSKLSSVLLGNKQFLFEMLNLRERMTRCSISPTDGDEQAVSNGISPTSVADELPARIAKHRRQRCRNPKKGDAVMEIIDICSP